MWYARLFSFLLIALSVVCPQLGVAATNPVLTTLAQASVVQFTGREAISEPFEFEVELATPDKALNLAMVVGQPLPISLAPGRVISGMVESIEQLGVAGDSGWYRLRLVPRVSKLKYRMTSRTFFDSSTTEVVSKVLAEAGISDFEFRIAAAWPKRELIVQYQESDFSFISRLLEADGIHYHFEHSAGGDKIVFSDVNNGFPVLTMNQLALSTTGFPAISSFARGLGLHSGSVEAGDYNWRTPTTTLLGTAQTGLFRDLTERIFPVGATTNSEAQALAQVRLGAHISEAQRCTGESSYTQAQAGYRFVLVGHSRAEFNQEHVITSVEHRGTSKTYRNTFRCLPANLPYRPSATTRRPTIGGVVSGIVVGPPGESKYVDQFGRVKVRFPWRSPAHTNLGESGDSGWVRVAQIATGAGNTAMWLPEVGDEVLVAFEHGDPNRAVVIGSVYNAKDGPPSPLPGSKHLSVLRNQSVTGHHSEIVFDNMSGNERLTLRSGNHFLTIGPDGITASTPVSTTPSMSPVPQPPIGLQKPVLPPPTSR